METLKLEATEQIEAEWTKNGRYKPYRISKENVREYEKVSSG